MAVLQQQIILAEAIEKWIASLEKEFVAENTCQGEK